MDRHRPFRLLAAGALLAAAALAPLPAPAGEGEKVPLDEFLKGRVVSLKDGVAEVHYDFKDREQLQDFRDYRPFRVDGRFRMEATADSLHFRGTGGVVWKPILRKTLRMEFEVRLVIPRDVGAFVAEDRESDHFTLFSLFDQYFQNKDTPGSAKQHMICRFLPEAPDSGGELAFRYVARNTRPPLAAGKTVKVKLGRDGMDDWMEIDGDKLQGNENNWTPLRGLRPGLYSLDSEAWFTTLVLRGEIDPKWAEEAGVDLSIPVKAAGKGKKPPREPNERDRAARARIEGVLSGSDPASSLLPILEDGELLDAVREEASRALQASGEARLVPRLIPLLESTDLAVRTLAGEVVSRLTGRSFGFRPDDPEEKRRKAVRSVLDFVERNPRKFQ